MRFHLESEVINRLCPPRVPKALQIDRSTFSEIVLVAPSIQRNLNIADTEVKFEVLALAWNSSRGEAIH